jgi:integrase
MAGSVWSTPRQTKDGVERHAVRYRLGGREAKPVTYGTVSADELETVKAELRLLLARGRDPRDLVAPAASNSTPASVNTFGQWLDEFEPAYARYHGAQAKRKETIRSHTRLLRRRFGHLPCELPVSEIQHWLDDLVADRRSRNTVVDYSRALQLTLNWAVAYERIPRNPMLGPDGKVLRQLRPAPPSKRLVWLTQPQFRSLVEAALPYFKTLYIVMGLCGLRPEEAYGLTVDSVVLDLEEPEDDGVVKGYGYLVVDKAQTNPTRRKADRRLKPTKTEEPRIIVLDDVAHAWLAWHLKTFPDGPEGRVFWSPGNNSLAQRGERYTLDDSRVGRQWRQARKRAGLVGLWPGYGELMTRDLRRTHVTWQVAQGAHPTFLAQRLGHGIQTMDKYYTAFDRAVRQGRLRTGDLFDTEPMPMPSAVGVGGGA